MLERALFPVQSDPGMARLATAQQQDARKPVFRMTSDPDGRINGSIPVWDDTPSTAERVSETLADARQGTSAPSPEGQAYAKNNVVADAAEPFGFGDIIDMVNPLQHIPLVNTVYRYLTNDTIKPVAQVIGGTLYGGPLGAATSFANVIIKEETGRDIAGNLTALAFNGGTFPPADNKPDIAIAANTTLSNLPGTAISFAALTPSPILPSRPFTPAAATQRLAMTDFSAFDIY
jgi:hypothetical protein